MIPFVVLICVACLCVIGEVQPLFMCFNGESNLPLEIPFLQFCLAYKSFSMTYLKTFFVNRYHLQRCRFVNCSAPSSIFQLVFWELATKQHVCCKPFSGYGGKLSPWSIPLPDWKLEWHVPVQTPRACLSLVAPFHFILRTNSKLYEKGC